MYCLISPYSNPYFNLASEEYLLKCFEEDVFLLYRNQPSIVVGKHQNTLSEINLPFVQQRGIMVARRISGGGTVFHDDGNLNFAIFTSGKEGELVDYRRATQPVLGALAEMGLKARLGKRNELLIKGMKISGTASHVYKKRVLHHGTLLFSSEMGTLSAALNSVSERFTDKAVKSVPSSIANIMDYLEEPMEMEEFQERILNYFLRLDKRNRLYQYSRSDIDSISSLCDTKFATWEWNFGYSPKYMYNRNISFDKGSVDIHINVEKGIIRELKLHGDFTSFKNIHLLEKLLTGTIHDPETMRIRLSRVNVSDFIYGLGNEEFLAGMF
jgi:lipoate---protein ligase